MFIYTVQNKDYLSELFSRNYADLNVIEMLIYLINLINVSVLKRLYCTSKVL